jgi:hypothetical protein
MNLQRILRHVVKDWLRGLFCSDKLQEVEYESGITVLVPSHWPGKTLGGCLSEV